MPVESREEAQERIAAVRDAFEVGLQRDLDRLAASGMSYFHEIALTADAKGKVEVRVRRDMSRLSFTGGLRDGSAQPLCSAQLADLDADPVDISQFAGNSISSLAWSLGAQRGREADQARQAAGIPGMGEIAAKLPAARAKIFKALSAFELRLAGQGYPKPHGWERPEAPSARM